MTSPINYVPVDGDTVLDLLALVERVLECYRTDKPPTMDDMRVAVSARLQLRADVMAVVRQANLTTPQPALRVIEGGQG